MIETVRRENLARPERGEARRGDGIGEQPGLIRAQRHAKSETVTHDCAKMVDGSPEAGMREAGW